MKERKKEKEEKKIVFFVVVKYVIEKKERKEKERVPAGGSKEWMSVCLKKVRSMTISKRRRTWGWASVQAAKADSDSVLCCFARNEGCVEQKVSKKKRTCAQMCLK